jgi:hypothetical protein
MIKRRNIRCEDRTGSGSCSLAGFGISGVEPSGSASRIFVKCCGNRLLELEGGWNWLRIASNGRLWYQWC